MKHNRKLKFKKLLLFGIILLLSVSGFGRDFKKGPYDHRIFSFNQGYAFSGSGDCWGIGNEISHLKTFAPILFHRESISSWLVNGKSWIDGGYDHITGFDFSIELGISPLKMKNRIMSITGGGCISYQSDYGPYQGGTNLAGDSYKTEVKYRIDKGFSPGFTLGVNYHTKVNSTIWFNARAAIRAFSSGNMLSILSVGIGFDPTKIKK